MERKNTAFLSSRKIKSNKNGKINDRATRNRGR
jgi:hypothetical protein